MDRAGYWFAAVEREQWPDDPAQREWIESHWDDAVGDCRQEIVFIGAGMDQAQIEATLDKALISDVEMAMGPATWLEFEDPLPSWDVEDEHAYDMSV